MPEQGRKGAVIKLFGVVLMILGGLDSMLSWRGGFAPSDMYLLLICVGGLLYGAGAIVGGGRRT